jgi:hypothetical protein
MLSDVACSGEQWQRRHGEWAAVIARQASGGDARYVGSNQFKSGAQLWA